MAFGGQPYLGGRVGTGGSAASPPRSFQSVDSNCVFTTSEFKLEHLVAVFDDSVWIDVWALKRSFVACRGGRRCNTSFEYFLARASVRDHVEMSQLVSSAGPPLGVERGGVLDRRCLSTSRRSRRAWRGGSPKTSSADPPPPETLSGQRVNLSTAYIQATTVESRKRPRGCDRSGAALEERMREEP